MDWILYAIIILIIWVWIKDSKKAFKNRDKCKRLIDWLIDIHVCNLIIRLNKLKNQNDKMKEFNAVAELKYREAKKGF